MAKIHFKKSSRVACGREGRTTDQVNRVTCLNCKKQPEFIDEQTLALAKEAEAFLAQEPRRFAEPWKPGHIICDQCLGDQFRRGNRTCYGHYDNFVCAACGSTQSRLTETGMSF